MKQVTIFSDGSSLGNPGPGGWCTILRFGKHEKELVGGEAMTTNNRMELMAVIEGLKALKEPCEVTIYSDSNYVVKAINEWLPAWIARDFKKVKNPDLWREYLRVAAPHRIKAVWVRGHSGHPENERCDELARKTAERYKNGT
ncbi:ribonuclease HI [Hydrogenimonas urashimensis]|uniref:ribonuclease HI n=1 Tax=Hydrogenimonas urashimensis TaxID=2740515 RepID=UPI0019168D1B|nr:ribonuclease HI [Hydrogenimonas urashimensis]